MSWKERLSPLISAADHFWKSSAAETRCGPHIRDLIDVKRWMILVVIALFPCILVAIWNTGVQSFVYSSANAELMRTYLKASESWGGYWAFVLSHWGPILKEGLLGFLPYVLISYGVGGFWEALFACVRRHEIAEGFLVSGILYALILPPTLPYWMAAVGISVGIVIAKELFGGTGMNILNPALACRCFLFFAFPAYMTGGVWAGRDLGVVRESLLQMNQQTVDGYSQQTCLAIYNLPSEVKRIHVDAIASNDFHQPVASLQVIQGRFSQWNQAGLEWGKLDSGQLQQFLTASPETGGLGLSSDHLPAAQKFLQLKYGMKSLSNWNLFLGNKLGSMGEVSVLASLLGAIFLILTGIASWRTMAAVTLGAAVAALLFEVGSRFDVWSPAQLDFPVYKQFLMGGLAFGLVFMATDPVSSPVMNSAKWAYGFLIGMLAIVIRLINPAFPEGIMLAILFGNVFAPLFDSFALRWYRREYVS